jgi:hypothetical protein
MTPQQVVAIGIRVLAIWLAVYGLEYCVSVPLSMNAANLAEHSYVAYSIGAAMLMVAALLWLFPMVIAHRILPRTEFENHLRLQPLEAARVGCALVGLWLFARTAPSFALFVVRAIANSDGHSVVRSLGAGENLTLVFYVIELALSFVLIYKSAAFARLALRDEKSRADGE